MPRISQEQKQQALSLLTDGLPAVQVAKLTGIHRETLRRWMNPTVQDKHRESNRQYATRHPERISHRSKEYRARNSEKLAIAAKNRYMRNREVVRGRNKVYYKKHREYIRAKSRQYYWTHRSEILAKQRRTRCACQERILRRKHTYKLWVIRNKAKVAAQKAEYHAAKIQATPPWLDDNHRACILAIYEHRDAQTKLTGQIHHVDHIIPLVAKRMFEGKYQHVACGLHVPWNLQVVPAVYNLAKNCNLEYLIE